MTEEKICRLCLKVICKNDYEIVEENLVMVKTIFVDLSWTISENPIMCSKCFKKVQNFYDFKSTCLTTEEDIKTTAKDGQGDADLWQIGEKNNQTSLEQKNICRLCLKLIEGDMCFNLEEKEDVPLMLQKCVPELDLFIVQESIICESCLVTLEGMFSFVMSCLGVEDIVNSYRISEGLNKTDQVNLCKVLQFTKIKKESDSDKMPVEDDDVFEEDVVKSEQVEDEEFQMKSEFSVKEEPLEFENGSEHSMKNENIEFKTETHSRRFDEGLVMTHPRVTTEFSGKQMSNLDEELPEPHVKQAIMKKTGKITMHKCEYCSFHTKYRHNLKTHLLTHKEPSEMTMYKCNACIYETNRKGSLRIHLLSHKNPSELRMYKCGLCAYEAKRETLLKRHLLIHEDSSQVTMHKCDSCSYQTKHIFNLKRHLLRHDDPSDVKIHKCDSCPYRTKCMLYFKRHLLKHKDPSVVAMHKCDSCLYQTVCLSNFKMHVLSHKDTSKITVYECSSCSYETKNKFHFKSHLLSHMDPSKVTMYKCVMCLYQTKRSSDLNRHYIRIHQRRQCTNMIDFFFISN